MKHSGSTITTTGRTTIPPEIRKTLGLTAGTRLVWQVSDTGGLFVHVKSKTFGGGRKLRPPRIAVEELNGLADAAKGAADRASAAIDGAMEFIGASDKRIAALEAKVAMEQDQAENLARLIHLCAGLPEATICRFTEIELDDSGRVQAALEELGHNVGRGVAFCVWRHYSSSVCAKWLSGAESVESARDTLLDYAKRVRVQG